MKIARSILRILFFCLGIPLACRAEHLVSLLPEKPLFVVSAADVKRLQELPEHKVAKLIATPQMRKAFAPLLNRMEEGIAEMQADWKKETGLETKEILAMFNGGASMGMAFSKMESAEDFTDLPPTEENMQGVIAVEFSGDEAVAAKVMEAFLKWDPTAGNGDEEDEDEDEDAKAKREREKEETLTFPDDYTEEVEEDGGTKLHIWLPKKETKKSGPNAWALVNKVLLLTNGEQTLRAAIEKVRQRGSGTAKEESGTLARAKRADVFFCLFTQPWVGRLLEEAADKLKQNARPGSPDAGEMFRWFGLDKVEGLYVSADFKNEAIDMEMGVTFAERIGLQKFIPVSGPGTAPDFLPPDATSGGYGTLALAGLMDTVDAFLADVFPPMRAMLATKLDDMRRQSGVDLQKDVLGNLGPNIWNVTGDPVASIADQLKNEDESAPPTPEPQVVGFQVKDRRTLEIAIASLLNWAAPGQSFFEKAEYQGFEIQQFKVPTMPLAYLVTDDWFILAIGPRVMLEKVLSRMKKGGGGDHLFAQPHVAAAIRALPEGGDGTSYTDIGAMLESFLSLAAQIPGGEEMFEDVLDLDALPNDLDLPLALASRYYNEELALRIRIHIEEKARP